MRSWNVVVRVVTSIPSESSTGGNTGSNEVEVVETITEQVGGGINKILDKLLGKGKDSAPGKLKQDPNAQLTLSDLIDMMQAEVADATANDESGDDEDDIDLVA